MYLYDVLRSRLFFEDFIVIGLQGYLELLITASLNLRKPLSTTSGEVVAMMISYNSVAMIVIIPIISLYAIVSNKKTIESAEFRQRYGAIIDMLRTKSSSKFLYYPCFMIKRLMFAGVTMYMTNT